MRLLGLLPTVSIGILISGAGVVQGLEIKLSGPRPAGLAGRKTKEPLSNSSYSLAAGDHVIPAQLDQDGRLWWSQSELTAGQTIGYELQARPAGEATNRVEVKPAGEGLIEVALEGKPFTAFHYGKDDPRPYLYPVIGPTGDPVTRDWPMKDNPAEKNGKRQDHPHHRSIWTAYGDVRFAGAKTGADFWSDNNAHGYQKVRRIVRTTSGLVFGQIVADVDWTNAEGKRELSDTRTYTFFLDGQDMRVIDYRIVFHFDDGDVTFADTKEGGIIAVRVATSIDEKGGGHMVNSAGQTGMKACWGQPADWCDYVGTVNGKTVGIAIFDAPTNFKHPERWHIRDYGLFAVNPFTVGAFTGNKNEDGSKTYRKGEKAEFNYRILIHKGETKEARVAEQYKVMSAEY